MNNSLKNINRSDLVTTNGIVRDTHGNIAICFINQGNTGVFVSPGGYLAPGDHLEYSTTHPNIEDYTDYRILFEDFIYLGVSSASFGGSPVSVVSNILTVITSFIKS